MTLSRNLLFCILFVIIGLLSAVNGSAEEQKYDLQITLEKQNYLLYEKIWLDATLTNMSTDSIRTDGIVAPNHLGFTIDLKDDSGKSVDYTGATWSMISGPGRILLMPGEHEYECFDMLEIFGRRLTPSGYTILGMFFPHIPVGSYTLQAHFEDVSSNELSFNIVEASGVEKEAFDIVLEAFQLWQREDTDPAGQKFQEIYNQYPNSVFAQTSLFLSRIYSENRSFEGRVDRMSLRKEMLQKFPNSGDTRGWIRGITYDLGPSEKAKVLNQTIEANPSSRSAKFSRQMLRKLQ